MTYERHEDVMYHGDIIARDKLNRLLIRLSLKKKILNLQEYTKSCSRYILTNRLSIDTYMYKINIYVETHIRM